MMYHRITIVFITGLILMATSSTTSAQPAMIYDVNVQIKATLNGSPIAWATKKANISLNKTTGEFEATLLVDNLSYAVINPEFTGQTGENLGKLLKIKGVIPVNEVVQKMNSVIDLSLEMVANFNDIDYSTFFTFTVLALQEQGFSVMANGPVSHIALEIDNLQELDDEMMIILSFTGK